MSIDEDTDRATTLTKDAYMIYRGKFRADKMPPHWDDLGFGERWKLIWISTYVLGAVKGIAYV